MRKTPILFSIIILCFLYQHLGAQVWSSPKRLTWNTGWSTLPEIAVSPNDHIHVIWLDSTPGNKELFYKRSTNGGTSWSSLTRLTWIPQDATTSAITVDSANRVHVAWANSTTSNIEIYYKRSLNSGITWQSNKRLTWNSGISTDVAICSSPSDDIYVVWADNTPGSNEIFYKKSTNNGVSWSVLKRFTWRLCAANSPAVIHDKVNGLHIVWEDYTAGNFELFHKRSTNGGTNWSAPQRLTWNSGTSADSCLAVNSSNGLFVTWHDSTPTHQEIYFKRSLDRGISWSTLKRMTWNADITRHPSMTVDSNNDIHIIWDYSSPISYTELYYKTSSNSGNTWAPVKRLTYTSGGSQNPVIAADSNNVIHAVWSESSTGNLEIFYKKRIPIVTIAPQ